MSEVLTRRLSGVRRFIADRMQQSLQQSAQLSYFAEADIGGVLAQREDWKRSGLRIGIEDCVIRALARTLVDFPEFNGTLDGEHWRFGGPIHVAVAIAAPSGLVTPVLREAQALSLPQLATERRRLVGLAGEGRLQVSDMKGGTITVSNLGQTRVRHFTPILNQGQLALLGLGRIEDVWSPAGDGLRPSRRLPLSLTADHRVIDGEPAGRFLDRLCQELEAFEPGI